VTEPSREEQSETRRERAGRYSHRARLYSWAALFVVVLVGIVVLVVENTRSVKVGWIFGYSHISLVFLVLFAGILGIATAVILHRRTRRRL
jgi:uncharacterized integral membrane protein